MGIHKTVLRDPVHGDIFLDAEDLLILDTREVQRLRGIKQLGTAYLVYPGATHTRFLHSVGTLHMASRMVDALRSNGAEISDKDEEIIRASALVHDVTHVPFGHTFEDERKALPRHDMDGKRIEALIKSGELGDVLKERGLIEPVMGATKGKGLFGDVLTGTICADLLDYVRRDLYFTGINGNFDDRIFRYFTVHNGKLVLNMEKSGELRRDALSTVIDILRLRYVLTERVYYHHAKASSGAMISKAVEMAIQRKNGLKSEDMYWMSDSDLIRYLRSRKETRKLAEGVIYRRIYKRAYVVSGDKHREKFVPYHQSPPSDPHAAMKNRESAEWVIASSLGLDSEDIIIYAPSMNMQMKEAEIPVKIPGEKEPLSLSSVPGLPEIDGLVENYRRLWRFYVFASPEAMKKVGRDRIRKACERHFGVGSEA